MSRTVKAMHRSWIRWGVLTVAVAGAAALALPPRQATAATPSVSRFHLALNHAEPGVDATVAASPASIKLWFTEPVQAAATTVRLSTLAKHPVALGAVSIDAAAKSPAVVAVKETLKPGKYTVQWKTMATDGHPSSGSFVFTVRAPATGK